MPPMPTGYSNDMLNMIKWMLHKSPDSRPSAKRILSDTYIRKYIQIFIEEAHIQKEKNLQQQPRLGHGVPSLVSSGGGDLNNSISSNVSGHRVPSSDRDTEQAHDRERDRERERERERDRAERERDRERDRDREQMPERMLSPSSASSSAHRSPYAQGDRELSASPSPSANRHQHPPVSQANSGGSALSAAFVQRPLTPLSRDDQRGVPPPRPPPPQIAPSSSSSSSQAASSALPNQIFVPDAPGPYAKLMALPPAPPPPPPTSSSHFISPPPAVHMYLPPAPSIPPSQVEARASDLMPPERNVFAMLRPTPAFVGAPERGDLRELRAERERKESLPPAPPLLLLLAPNNPPPAPVPVAPTPGSVPTSGPAPSAFTPIAPPRVFQPPPDKLPVAPPPPSMHSQAQPQPQPQTGESYGSPYEPVQVQVQAQPQMPTSMQSFLPPATQSASAPSQSAPTPAPNSSSASSATPSSHSEPVSSLFSPPPLPQKDYSRGDPSKSTVCTMQAPMICSRVVLRPLLHFKLIILVHILSNDTLRYNQFS